MINTAEKQDLIIKTAIGGTIKLLLIVKLDRAEQQRRYISKAIKDGIVASSKGSGRKKGALDKMTEELETDLKLYLKDRTITQNSVMKKHGISRNTLKNMQQRLRKMKVRVRSKDHYRSAFLNETIRPAWR